MEVDKGIKLEETESGDFVNSGVELKKESERCVKCLEWQDKCKHLELDIGKKNTVIECLEGKLGFMELKKLKVEDEVRLLKQRNEELQKSTQNGEDDDKITQLMIENKVLECEKNKAESEIGVWKLKCKELETRVTELEKRLSAELVKTGSDLMHGFKVGCGPSAGTPPMNTPHKNYTNAGGINGGQKCEPKLRARKSLDFAAGERPDKNISPSTPGGRPPCGLIEISDSDDDLNNASLPKRSRVRREVAYRVTSESESGSDDNFPICRLRHRLPQNSDTLHNKKPANDSCSRGNRDKLSPRRRLVRVGNLEDKGILGNKSTETMNDTVVEDEMEEDDDSSSEGESLGGFIVNSSDGSKSASASNSDGVSENHGMLSGDGSGDSEHASESSMEYGEVISSLRRDRKDKMKWEYEADMLADFGKCAELCMRAVCALYRQQTAEEKSSKATIIVNGRGFNQIHAYSGSALAEFLTDGDPHSDIKKPVKELQEFNSKGVEQCRKLATHYSRQLFEIYKNGKDPFFHP